MQQEGTPVTQRNQDIKAHGIELKEVDHFMEYFETSSFLFSQYYGTQETIDATCKHSRGWISLEVYTGNNKEKPTIEILRNHANYEKLLQIQDSITVENRLLNDQNNGTRIVLNFEINYEGKMLKRPKSISNTDYMKSLLIGFMEASQVKDSSIYIGNSIKFVSDGKKWIPAPLPPAVDLRIQKKRKPYQQQNLVKPAPPQP